MKLRLRSGSVVPHVLLVPVNMFPLAVNVDSNQTWAVPVPPIAAKVPGHVTAIVTFEPTSRVEDGVHADEPLLDPLAPPLEELPPLDELDPAPLLLLPATEPLELLEPLLVDPLGPPELDELPDPPEPLPLPEPDEPELLDSPTVESLPPPQPPTTVASASTDPPQIAPMPRTRIRLIGLFLHGTTAHAPSNMTYAYHPVRDNAVPAGIRRAPKETSAGPRAGAARRVAPETCGRSVIRTSTGGFDLARRCADQKAAA
jgi:hypothetical protein